MQIIFYSLALIQGKGLSMEYRRLGASNLRVSSLCLGTMMFDGQTTFDEAERIVASAREVGINFIDTADVYNGGHSEEAVGKLLNGQQYDWVLATKLGNAVFKKPNWSHYSRQWIVHGVDLSLARLATDYIDIVYMHRDFENENLEEAIRALGDLICAGKLRSFGLSNFRGWRIAEVIRLCRELNVPSRLSVSPITTCSIAAPRSRSCRPAATMAWGWYLIARLPAAC